MNWIYRRYLLMLDMMKSRLISPLPRLYLWRRDKAELASEGNGPTFVIVARSQCRFRGFQRVASQDGPKERAALSLKIQDWLPFKPSGFTNVTSSKQQLVWAWDKDKADRILRTQNLNARRVSFVPESLMVAPGKDEIRLLACVEGYEGQIWANAALVESRWWPEMPSDGEWVAFQRAAGTKPDLMTSSVPKPISLPWLNRPWGTDRNSLAAMVSSFEPKDLGLAAAFVVTLPIVYFLAATIHIQVLLSDTNDRIAKLEVAAGPILNAQSFALAAIGQVKAMTALDPYPAQIAIMGKFATVLPMDGSKVVEWTFQTGDLEVGIQSQNPIDARSYVQRFEGAGMFKDVSLDRSNPLISKLKLKVLPKDQITNPAPTPALDVPNIDMSGFPPGAKIIQNPTSLPGGLPPGFPAGPPGITSAPGAMPAQIGFPPGMPPPQPLGQSSQPGQAASNIPPALRNALMPQSSTPPPPQP